MSEDLDSNYARAGYHRRLGFGQRPALVLIDFVQAYFEPTSPLYAGVETAFASALRLRAVARRARIPVILSKVVLHPGGHDGGIFRRKVPALSCMEAGNPLGDFPEALSPAAEELVLTKQYPSAFFGTCVDAMSHGFITVVARDACGDRAAGPHEANLFDMNAKYADVVDEADAVAALQATKG